MTILVFFLTLSSLLLGSAFGKLLAKYLVFTKGINLFSQSLIQNTPLFDAEVARAKSFDILEFLLFIVISLAIFTIFALLYKRKKYTPLQQILIGSVNAIFAFFVYLSVVFVNSSGVQTIVFSAIWYTAIFVISFFLPKETPSWNKNKNALFNGIVTGFYLLILLNNLTTSVALPLAIFVCTPICFYLYSNKFNFLNHPAFALFIFSFAFPFNRIALAVIPMISAATLFLTKDRVTSRFGAVMQKIYPLLILFIFLYNPLFYLGTFDSIEEGFWAGWLERLLNRQVMYKDFAAYHPPLLTWGLYIFTKVFGPSLYNIRLYFHILQILGLSICYFVVQGLVKSKWIQLGIFILILAYGLPLVRNNMEIRVFLGIAPLLSLYWYNLRKSKIYLLVAGALTSLALFTSIETGIAGVVAVILSSIIFSKGEAFKKLGYIAAGFFAVTLPILLILIFTGSLNKFAEYITYYAGTFSSGYQNFPIGREQPQTLLQWFLVERFVSTPGFLWELSIFSLVGTACLLIIQKVRKVFASREILTLGIMIFGLVLSRSALGRSDQYHITFIWIVALLLIGYFLQIADSFSKTIPLVILSILIFFVGREATQVSLIQNQLLKFQTYGNLSGSYPSYAQPRAGINTGIEINTAETDRLIKLIDAEVDKNATIFVFPQAPEIYFLSDRRNATSFDTPTTFYTSYYQKTMINELKNNQPKLIIYKLSDSKEFINDSLHDVNEFILQNYKAAETFGDEVVMRPVNRMFIFPR